MSNFTKVTIGMVFATLAGGANAVYDTTAITTGVADAVTAVGAIGAAVVLVVLAVKVFKWIARAL